MVHIKKIFKKKKSNGANKDCNVPGVFLEEICSKDNYSDFIEKNVTRIK